MSKNRNDKLIFEASGHLDDDLISEVLAKYEAKKSVTQNRFAKMNRGIKIAVAVAACLVLLAVAVPTATIVIEHGEYTPPTVGAENSGVEVESSPEHDGSKGLIYEVNEDGKTVSFVSFGTCTDEVVYIASTYNGMPVTEMHNVAYWEADYIPADHGFNSKYVKRLVISDTVQIVDFECIRQCPNIESVYYGASVARIHELPFNGGYGQNFSKVEVSPNNPNFSDKGNCIVDLRTKTLVVATPTTIIPDDGSVEIIGFMAFASAKAITSIVIPEGVKVIDHGAFQDCMNLESVTLPDSLEVIEISAFNFCQSLKTLELGTNLKAFNQMVFHNMYCPKLYYKGTVAEWEAVAKPSNSNHPLSIPIICTDGESLSNAGNQSQYHWMLQPEFEMYWKERRGEFMPERQYRETTRPPEVHVGAPTP